MCYNLWLHAITQYKSTQNRQLCLVPSHFNRWLFCFKSNNHQIRYTSTSNSLVVLDLLIPN